MARPCRPRPRRRASDRYGRCHSPTPTTRRRSGRTPGTSSWRAGPDFLVAPVYSDTDVRGGIRLPKGTWTDYWTGRMYQGPTTVNGYSAPLDTLPVFVRGGAIIPMCPKGTLS
ncbi:TIM-barrel domain-containing protein [Streptomyces sp. V3I7]|uniref:TIM-barrel domain-containing protein n=1 Tax=Streptomyces sp. V3I7 TaxID=3042278 RepID=UPI0027820686|nr:TIM-barrel domain-containing protein [Streptomyces sp. V3I7]MDQ0994039.1 hypothetical protein [Streptomyces sp. V3I7]